jgi:hypothetical protein
MSPQRGGWEAVSRMFQPVLGDETPEDCDPWTRTDLTVAAVIVAAIIYCVLKAYP